MQSRRFPGFTVSPLTATDLPAAARLVEESRWNQVAADWELFLAQGQAFQVRAEDGTLAATAATLPCSPFGWISMVLVTQAYRRRGIASALLQMCVRRLRDAGLVPALDATPAGREVYRPLGFRDGWAITRWRRSSDLPVPLSLPLRGRAGEGAPPAPTLPTAAVTTRPLASHDWPAIARLDAHAFGADRLPLLRSLQARSRAFACVAEQGGRLAGVLLGRDGRLATQFGPILATSDEVAQALLAHALARVEGAVIVDALDRHSAFAQLLQQTGFAFERPYTRMTLDHDGAFGDAATMVAIAGPELG